MSLISYKKKLGRKWNSATKDTSHLKLYHGVDPWESSNDNEKDEHVDKSNSLFNFSNIYLKDETMVECVLKHDKEQHIYCHVEMRDATK